MKLGRTEEEYRLISRHLREFGIKKRQFLNAENRQIIAKDAAGKQSYVRANATGMGFFKPDDLERQIDRRGTLDKS